jgi:hypothetical protein
MRVPGAEASNAQSMDPGNDCPQRHNKKVAGSGRLEAAFVPTGHEQKGGQSSVAWLRKKQDFSREGWAGSATSERYVTCVFD